MVMIRTAQNANPTNANQTDQMRLALFQDINFSGRRILFRNGSVAVRDIRAFDFNDQLSSFRVRATGTVTLVLFEDVNFQGRFLVFRGNQNVADLRQFNFNDLMSSFVFVRGRLTTADIQRLQQRGRAPRTILEITI